MYEKVLLWATPVFLIMIALECAVAALRRRSPYRLGDALGSVSLGALSTYVGVYTRLFSFGIYVALYDAARLTTLDDSRAWVWVAAVVLYDFLYYWNHRLGHEINVLWAAHVVHHQSEEFNLSTALRQTSSSFLLSWLFYVPMALAGFPPRLFLFVSLIDLLYQFWIHTEQIGSLGVLDRLLATPSNHRVHHGVNDEYLDRNYGGILIVWDRLFGTFQAELASVPVVYGTRDPLRSWNPLWANLHTYAALLRDAALARSWADRVRVFCARPGWRPDDVVARDPKPAFELSRHAKFAPSLPAMLGAYCLLQGFGILGLGAFFMARAPGWPVGRALAWLALLVGSQWILGGLTQARRGFAWLEGARIVLIASLVLASVPAAEVRDWTAAAAVAIMLGAACLGWLWLGARALRTMATP
jgi:sterol desaturase/sphingolipid hydroxylase (fatty acid hydroxylase superfamily)